MRIILFQCQAQCEVHCKLSNDDNLNKKNAQHNWYGTELEKLWVFEFKLIINASFKSNTYKSDNTAY